MYVTFALLITALVTCHGPAFADKAKIGIGEIVYRAKDSSENKQYAAYGSGFREDTRAFVDMLTTALVKTRKFDVVERDRMTEILKEQSLTVAGIASNEYGSGRLNLQGLNYILTGAITEYGKNAQATRIGGFGTAKEIATMAVDIRVLDVSNGSIKIAETVRQTVDGASAVEVNRVDSLVGGRAGQFLSPGVSVGKGQSEGILLGEVMRRTAQNVTNMIVTTVYPIKIVAINEDGEVMLNYGNSLLQNGDSLEVFSQGEAFVDPDTGETLGQEEELVGKMSVFDTQAKFSKARVIEGSEGIEKGMIARMAAKEEAPQKSKKKIVPW